MESILEQFYSGTFSIDDYIPVASPAYCSAFEQLIAADDSLHQLLTPELYQKVEELKNFSSEIEHIENLSVFCCGMKLGAKLMQEFMKP